MIIVLATTYLRLYTYASNVDPEAGLANESDVEIILV